VPFLEIVRVFTRIGLQSFGGPAGQIATMHKILVEEKGWIGEAQFLHALNFCMLLPGPEAQQLSVYTGWLLDGMRGGIVAGTLFVLPGFLTMLALSWAYALWRHVVVVDAVFFGLKAAVVAIVAAALVRIGRRALLARASWAVAVAAFVGLAVFGVPFPAVVAGAFLFGLACPGLLQEAGASGATGGVHPETAPPSLRRLIRVLAVGIAIWSTPLAVLTWALGPRHILVQQGAFFSKAALVTFGGAYAVLSYVSTVAVARGWLVPAEMLDGLGLAETTPGPLILVVQFVAFLGAWRDPGGAAPWAMAVAASVLVAWVTFVPSFVWIFAGAPYVESIRRSVPLRGALAAVTAAVVGVIANLSLNFSLHALFSVVATRQAGPVRVAIPEWGSFRPVEGVLAVGALVLALAFRWSTTRLLVAAAACGAAYTFWVGP
jgi:chromate transporter